MEIRWLGHSCFEFSDGNARVLVDPFLKPNSPTAPVTAEEVEPTHVLLSHGHADHVADAVGVATRTGAPVVAIVELAKWLDARGVPQTLRPESRRDRRVRLGLGQARAGVSHEHDAERRGGP